MKQILLAGALSATTLTLPLATQAADIRFNGFASVIAGKTLSEGTTRDRFTGIETDNTYTADNPTGGIYDDDISFKPDSVFGLQITADLGNNLTVVGQLTGHGGEDYDAEFAWAYISYDLNENWNLQAGRQRLPLFFYSDFLDVGYAYHWIRVPQELPATFNDTFEGLKIAYSTSTGNWDWRFDAYGGATDVDASFGDIEVNDIYGGVIKTSNDWLQLRATYVQQDIHAKDPLGLTRNGTPQLTDDNRMNYEFAGIAAHATLGNGFLIGEYTISSTEDPVGPDNDGEGFDNDIGWYISYAHRFGDFTPHITYAEHTTEYSDEMPSLTSSADAKEQAWTIGVRWDFHPSAAFKLEYTTRENDNDHEIENVIGGFGIGEPDEVDLISAGFDVIF